MTLFRRISNRFSRPRAPEMQLICAGAHKAGTTWLCAMLNQHPDVQIGVHKELHYFDTLHGGMNYPQILRKLKDEARRRAEASATRGERAWAQHFETIAASADTPDDDWYRRAMMVRGPRRLSADYTPEYLCLGAEGIEHIRALMPDCRIVILIREPVARMVSALNMALFRRPNMQPDAVMDHALFAARGDYATHLPQWDAAFGKQVLYLPFGQIAHNPAALLAEVEAHLGLAGYAGYQGMAQVKNSHTGRFELPQSAIERIQELAAPQARFLQTRFGAEFCAQI